VAVGDSHGYAVSHEPTLIDLSLLMRGITTAIVTHNLRAKIENASDGWYATLTIASDSLIDCLTPHHDKECSIALLKAYVAWLESRAP
jgi:hypothetical protein